ncbi:MAG TPA: imidazoleglycerol-phosphate dehydratase HisB [Syntrophales bacterium]|jgi:imidazoleglycerol-phosphate dehydratase|nr:imidazoleglycerol-phosphate dehydratase HisB [Syntrophales bacterium]HQA83027.1 imidazoleglycerol-phosphate dehydratase HisB [Syntrophales bacterium]
MARRGEIHRKTSETEIDLSIDLDGNGTADLATSIPFLDHMLNLFARHSGVQLVIRGQGDTHIDDHHLAEDLGICLGEAVKKALGDKGGIRRYGSVSIPMDETLCNVATDISGRPYLVYHSSLKDRRIGGFDSSLLREFFKAFTDHAGITLHINVLYGRNTHHMAEAIFKAFAHAFKEAVAVERHLSGVLSTKGSLD